MSHYVELNTIEMQKAVKIGGDRRIFNLKNKTRDDSGKDQSNGWHCDIEGAMGECAFSVWSGIPWDGNFGDYQADDVGVGQIRTTKYWTGDLWFFKTDKPAKIYILVTGENGHYRLRGWLHGRDGMRDEYWTTKRADRPESYFVPQSKIHPMPRTPEEMIRILEANEIRLAA